MERLVDRLALFALECLWWIVVKLAAVAAGAVWLVTFWLVVFAVCVRINTLISGEEPHLRSFDPRKREAAVEAAAREYGVQP